MTGSTENTRPPLPPFEEQSAVIKVRMAEDAWNTRDPDKVSLAYTTDSVWRNRAEFFTGRQAIVEFLTRKWNRELEYRLIKELWAFCKNRIAVRFAHEWHDDSGQWYRAYGNENWEFGENGLMCRRMQVPSHVLALAVEQVRAHSLRRVPGSSRKVSPSACPLYRKPRSC